MTKTDLTTAQSALPTGFDLSELEQDALTNPRMDVGDVALPFITILQAGSPQVNPGHGKYVEGAQASMFLNTVNGRVYEGRKDGLIIVPAYYERKLVEWIDRDNGGGGWVTDYPIRHPIAATAKPNTKGIPTLPNGHLLVETAYHYALYLDNVMDRWSQGLIAIKSTGLKKNRQLNNSIAESTIPGTDKQAPRFMFPYTMRTVFEEKGGNSWWNFDFTKMESVVERVVYEKARDFANLARSGAISRNAEPLDDDAASDGQQRPRGTGERSLDDDIPF